VYARFVTVEPAAVTVVAEEDRMTDVVVAAAALSVMRSVEVAYEVLKIVEVAALRVLVPPIVLVLVTLV